MSGGKHFDRLRAGAVAIGILGGFWLSWQILVIAISDYFALAQPDVSIAWAPEHAEALEQIAERRLELSDDAPEPDLADLAERIMLEKPLSGMPFRAFAILAEANKDDDRAKSLMRIAAARTLRDVRAQMWLADDELLKGNYSEALTHIDILLRVWPEFVDTLFPVLVDLAARQESAGVLVAALQRDPPWRSRFLAAIPRINSDLTTFESFYSALRSGPVPLKAEELRPYLIALIENGAGKQARTIWLNTLDPEVGDSGVYNGDFELPISGPPFDWSFEENKGAAAKVVAYAQGNNALLVEFYNTREPFRHVSQVLSLEPASYKLTGKARLDALQNDRGIQWTISCNASAKEQIAATDRTRGTLPWTAFEVDFKVPSQGCDIQILRLEIPARVQSEQKASGAVWFDNLKIDLLAPTN